MRNDEYNVLTEAKEGEKGELIDILDMDTLTVSCKKFLKSVELGAYWPNRNLAIKRSKSYRENDFTTFKYFLENSYNGMNALYHSLKNKNKNELIKVIYFYTLQDLLDVTFLTENSHHACVMYENWHPRNTGYLHNSQDIVFYQYKFKVKLYIGVKTGIEIKFTTHLHDIEKNSYKALETLQIAPKIYAKVLECVNKANKQAETRIKKIDKQWNTLTLSEYQEK